MIVGVAVFGQPVTGSVPAVPEADPRPASGVAMSDFAQMRGQNRMSFVTWLESLIFLNDAQRDTLEAQHLDSPAAVRRIPLAVLVAAPVSLPVGIAGLLLEAAESPPAPEPEPDTSDLVIAALDAAVADRSKFPELVGVLGAVVVGTREHPESDALNGPATKALLQHVGAGGEFGSTWDGLRVVLVRDLVR